MGTVSTYTFSSDTETVTRTKLNNLVAQLLNEFNGSITNANIGASAAIDNSKLNLTSISQAVTLAGATIVSGTFSTQAATTLGNASGDDITITGSIAASIPLKNETIDIGTTSIGLNDLHFGSGGVINFDGGDVTLTHSAAKITVGGDGAVELDFNNHEMTNVDVNSGAIDGVTIGGASAHGEIFYNDGSNAVTKLANGTQGQVLTSNGAAAPSWNTGGSVEMFTTGGTWTCPAGVNYILITLVGAGGGGGGGSSAGNDEGGGGGGGGATILDHLYAVTPTNEYTITLGTGGPGGAGGAEGSTGTAGGDSTFADGVFTLTAAGGSGGLKGDTGGGTGGAGGTGNTDLDPADFETRGLPYTFAGGAGGVGAEVGDGAIGGMGGGTMLGQTGGAGQADGVGTVGVAGGGGAGGDGTTESAGGAGGNGICILKYSANGTPS